MREEQYLLMIRPQQLVAWKCLTSLAIILSPVGGTRRKSAFGINTTVYLGGTYLSKPAEW